MLTLEYKEGKNLYNIYNPIKQIILGLSAHCGHKVRSGLLNSEYLNLKAEIAKRPLNCILHSGRLGVKF